MDVAALGFQVDSASLDAATPKLDKLTVAATKAEAATSTLSKTANTAHVGVARTGAAAQGATTQMGKFGGASANVFAQLNDIAVMMAAGQNPMQLAMQQGMQLNQVWAQLGGNIKSIGGAIGGAFLSMLNPINLVTIGIIAFGSAAVNWFMSSGDEAKKTKSAMDELIGSVDQYIATSQRARVPTSELKEEFGSMAFAAREALQAIADAEKKAAIDNLGVSIKKLASTALSLEVAMGSGGKGVEAAIFNMGLARQEAIDLQKAFVALTEANTLQDQADAAIALAAELDAARNAAGELPAPLQAAYDETKRIIVEAARLSGEIEKSKVSIWDFVKATIAGKSGIQGMSAETTSLTAFMGLAVNKAWELAYAAGQARIAAVAAAMAIPGMDNPDPNAQGMTDRELQQTEFLTGLVKNRVAAEDAAKALKEMGKSGGGAGKKISEAQKKAEKALKDSQKAAEQLREEMEAPMVNAVEGVSDAFGEFVAGGLKDFQGLKDGILGSFKSMIADMISYALKNRIMMSMGLTTGISPGFAAAQGAVPGAAGGGGGILSLLTGGGSGGTGGIGGFIGGLGGGASNVISGLLSDGIGGVGTALSEAIGGISGGGLAGIGTAIGAIGTVVAGIGLVASFFKTKKTLLDGGFKLTVKGMNSLVETFQTVEKKKFWGLSKSVSTTMAKAEDAIANPIERAVYRIQKSVMKNAAIIGVAGKTFAKFSKSIWFSTKDMTKDQIQEELTKRLQGLGNAFAGMVPGLRSMRRGGEGLMDTLARVAIQFRTVNATWRTLGFSLYDTSIKGAKATDAIIKIFGNLQNFLQSSAFYFDNFYSGQEKVDELQRKLGIGLKRAGVSGGLPATIEEYRALVDELEGKGRDKAAARLIKLAPLFVQLQDALGGLDNAAQSLIDTLDPNNFASLYEFNKAKGLLRAGMITADSTKPGIYSAPQSTASNVAAGTSPAVTSSNGAEPAPNAGSENNDAILVQILQQIRKLVNIETRVLDELTT